LLETKGGLARICPVHPASYNPSLQDDVKLGVVVSDKYPQLAGEEIIARCPGCSGEPRSFEMCKNYLPIALEVSQDIAPPTAVAQSFFPFCKWQRVTAHHLYKCRKCGLVAYARLQHVVRSDFNGNQLDRNSVLEDFYPRSVAVHSLPVATADTLAELFRDAERCEQEGLFRAAVATLRAALEHLLKINGHHAEPNLYKRIAAARSEGVITVHLFKRADALRDKGNESLHEFQAVDALAAAELREFLASIIREFYEHRESVEATLKELKRIGGDS
jgi:hypothetical protein